MENRLLLAFYGDDFTGSTDAMEALATSKYRTVLFMTAPSADMLQQFPGLRCFGVAGTSRAKDPDAMDQELRPVFERLAQLPVSTVHYKTCSTFDSSPEIGSIGKAIAISRDYFKGRKTIPILVGAPALGRFTLFGQHFARMQNVIYRLDRHPTMSRHPVTPMKEADLRLHLAQQTSEQIALMDILELEGAFDQVKDRFDKKIAGPAGLLLFDVLDDQRLLTCARLIWEANGTHGQFIVGSSGWEYALTAYWKSIGLHPLQPCIDPPSVSRADRVLVVSGSCSPVTRTQIQWALAQGFHGLKLPLDETVDFHALPADFLEQACRRLRDGNNVVVYTASGPEDQSIARLRERFRNTGLKNHQAGELLGGYLGSLTREIVRSTGIRRVVVAGGDTAGFVTRKLGISALEMILPVSPGAPLCRAYGGGRALSGLELALKGGQMGDEDYFGRVLMVGRV